MENNQLPTAYDIILKDEGEITTVYPQSERAAEIFKSEGLPNNFGIVPEDETKIIGWFVSHNLSSYKF
jgi:hypothetical protein